MPYVKDPSTNDNVRFQNAFLHFSPFSKLIVSETNKTFSLMQTWKGRDVKREE